MLIKLVIHPRLRPAPTSHLIAYPLPPPLASLVLLVSHFMQKDKILEGEVVIKSSFLSPKRYFVLYDDLVGIFKSASDTKPIMLVPTECMVAVNASTTKDTQLEITYCGKTDTMTQVFALESAELTKQWVEKLSTFVLPPALRARKQLDYRNILSGKFWEDVVGVAMANRDKSGKSTTKVRHILLQGPLKKKSPKTVLGRHVWQTRVFVLHEDSLVYYRSKDEPPAGAVLLRDITEMNLNAQDSRLDILINVTGTSSSSSSSLPSSSSVVGEEAGEEKDLSKAGKKDKDKEKEKDKDIKDGKREMCLQAGSPDEIRVWHSKIEKVRAYVLKREKAKADGSKMDSMNVSALQFNTVDMNMAGNLASRNGGSTAAADSDSNVSTSTSTSSMPSSSSSSSSSSASTSSLTTRASGGSTMSNMFTPQQSTSSLLTSTSTQTIAEEPNSTNNNNEDDDDDPPPPPPDTFGSPSFGSKAPPPPPDVLNSPSLGGSSAPPPPSPPHSPLRNSAAAAAAASVGTAATTTPTATATAPTAESVSASTTSSSPGQTSRGANDLMDVPDVPFPQAYEVDRRTSSIVLMTSFVDDDDEEEDEDGDVAEGEESKGQVATIVEGAAESLAAHFAKQADAGADAGVGADADANADADADSDSLPDPPALPPAPSASSAPSAPPLPPALDDDSDLGSPPLPPVPPPSFSSSSSAPLSSSSASSSVASVTLPTSPPLPAPLDDDEGEDDADDECLPPPPPPPPTAPTVTATPTPANESKDAGNGETQDDDGEEDDFGDDDDDEADDGDFEQQGISKSTRTSIKSLVSKKKKRFVKDGFDLDLTYITPNIIAMGFPAEGFEATYRNNMTDVQRFFTQYHNEKYRIYNLCSERAYDSTKFDNRCRRFPFDDHNPPPFRMMHAFCKDAEEFLNASPDHVIAVHCKAGKGRTGLMITALLQHMKHPKGSTASAALQFYGHQRTVNGKGVTIPSQIRFVNYYGQALASYYRQSKAFPTADPVISFVGFDLQPKCDFDTGGGSDPYVVVKTVDPNGGGLREIYNSRKDKKASSTHGHWSGGDVPFSSRFRISVAGEVLLTFMDYDAIGSDDKMFKVWIQTSFIQTGSLVLTKDELDGAVGDKKCKHFPANFTCTLHFDTTTAPVVPPLLRAFTQDPSTDASSPKKGQQQQQQQPQQDKSKDSSSKEKEKEKDSTRRSSQDYEEKDDEDGNEQDDLDVDDENFIADDDDDDPDCPPPGYEDDDDNDSDAGGEGGEGGDGKSKTSTRKQGWSMTNAVRTLVSKKKKRFVKDGFDLDLTYITPNIIAMGFPSEGLEAAYRNKMSDVQNFLKKYHAGHYKVYNLCSERSYSADRFESCARYPFDDHNPCSILTLFRFCEDAGTFLSRHPSNTVAIHCKAGKGRTGLMIAALLLFTQHSVSAADALQYYGKKRTSNRKGVTIPSQQRFVWYFEQFLKIYYYEGIAKDFPFKGIPAYITKIVLRPRADFDRGGGCDPYFTATDLEGNELFNYKRTLASAGKKVAKWPITISEHHLDFRFRAEGEVKFNFYDYDSIGKDDKMFHFWISTTFLPGEGAKSLTLTKDELDKAVGDKNCDHFPSNFTIQIFFEPAEM